MKKKMRVLLATMALCMGFLSAGAGAQAKSNDWKANEIDYSKYIEISSQKHYMNVMNNGEVQFISFNSYANKVGDKLYTLFQRNTIGKNEIKETGTFKGNFADDTDEYFDDNDYVKPYEKGTVVLNKIVKKSKVIVYIDEYDRKGKHVFSYTDSFKYIDDKNTYIDIEISNVWICGDRIYYSYQISEKDENVNVRYIDKSIKKANKKVKKSDLVCSIDLSKEDTDCNAHEMVRGDKKQIYILLNNKVNVYSLKGKKTASYKLPKGERILYTDVPDYDAHDPSTTTYKAGMIINNFCTINNKVYYCNRNGVYSLRKNGKAKLIYNAKNDEFFGSDYGVADICVKDDDTMYIMFNHISNYEVCVYNWAYKLVRYSRK